LVARHRRELLAHAHGDVLEIGFGSGLNLPFYPAGVRMIATADPNAGMQSLARKRIEQTGIEVDRTRPAKHVGVADYRWRPFRTVPLPRGRLDRMAHGE
jgi:protein-L-isoaspartate O-methyltransferase